MIIELVGFKMRKWTDTKANSTAII